MPIIDSSDYKPPFLLRNGHLNSMYSPFFRKKIELPFVRERFITSDEDFVDLDHLKAGNRRLAILCHGLEGSRDSQYMMNTSAILSQNNWDVLVFNYRSCSGEMNLKLQMYHSGWTQDLHEIVTDKENDYDEISLVGYSLGGNVVLKYTTDGTLPLSPKIKSIVAVSTPCDLSASSQKIISRQNIIYDKRFRMTLKEKMKQKHQMYPNEIPINKLENVKTLWDFDEHFTGPLHGFDGAEDYYSKCSSKQFLNNTTLPTLMITAQDDPFLTRESLIFEIAFETNNLYFMAPKFGGHVGFTTFGQNFYWNEQKILQFINSSTNFCSNHKHLSL